MNQNHSLSHISFMESVSIAFSFHGVHRILGLDLWKKVLERRGVPFLELLFVVCAAMSMRHHHRAQQQQQHQERDQHHYQRDQQQYHQRDQQQYQQREQQQQQPIRGWSQYYAKTPARPRGCRGGQNARMQSPGLLLSTNLGEAPRSNVCGKTCHHFSPPKPSPQRWQRRFPKTGVSR